MAKETAIKLSKDFKRWLDSVGRKGETYEDVIKAIIFNLPPEKFEEQLKKHAYSYHSLAKNLGLKIKESNC
jgi:mRNA-degrading endonuclease YafQ of YafQ-DinJ toxin-antitoxin module